MITPQQLAEEISAHVDAGSALLSSVDAIVSLGEAICASLGGGGTLYTFGNGGSAADAQHFAAELVGRFRRERRPLRAVALTTDPSVTTCIGNDYGYDDVFSRPVRALAGAGDVVVGFTTSGRSRSIVRGLEAGRERGATTVLLAAGDGGECRAHADVALLVPAATTARIQELHLLVLHLLSEVIDEWAARTEAELSA